MEGIECIVIYQTLPLSFLSHSQSFRCVSNPDCNPVSGHFSFEPIVRASRCRRWITGFSTGQLVPSSPTRDGVEQSTRWRRRASHGTRPKTRDNPPVSLRFERLPLIELVYLSCLPRPGHLGSPSLPSLFPRARIFTASDLNGPRRKAPPSIYFYQPFPNQLFPFPNLIPSCTTETPSIPFL